MTATLKLLGGMSLEDESGPPTGQVVQRRRLALLAVLGASRSAMSRDRLVALLWPELDAEGARHRLSDSVYVIRRALGEDAVVAAGDDVRLDDALVRVDVREFERALDAGSLEEATALYAGAFLDGLHLTDAVEFERWVDGERARLAGRYAHALRSLASAAERRRDFAAAAGWLRRLAAVDPLDTRVALRLMDALERSGDGAAALRHARVHQALRHAELELGEDPGIRAAADALAARLEAATTTPPADARSNVVHNQSAVDEESLGVDGHDASSVRRRRFGVLHVAGAALAVAALVLAGRWALKAPSWPTQVGDGSRSTGVAVFPFVVRSVDQGDIPGEAMAVLLATKLDGGAGWRSIDPNALFAQYRRGPDHPDPAAAARLARRLGADYFVLGDIVRVSDRVNLGAALYDARTGAPVLTRVAAQGASPALFELVDSLAARLLVARGDEPVPQFARLAALTTSSLSALKDYLDGEAQLRDGHYTEAAEHFRRAVAADSTFALAHYRLAWTYGWSHEADAGVPFRMAMRYGARLPERIRLTVNAIFARQSGNVEEAERLLRSVVARHADDFDAHYELGDLLFHTLPPRGIPVAAAREPLARATVLDPSRSAEPLFHLIVIAAGDGRFREVDSLATRFLALYPTGELSISMPSILALVRHDSVGIERAGKDLARLPTESALRVASVAIGMGSDLAGGARLLATFDDPSRRPSERARVLIAMARLAGGRGEWALADSLFARARSFDAPAAIEARARLLTLPIGDPPRASLQSAWGGITNGPGATQPRNRLLAGLLSVRLSDVNAAQRVATDLASLPPNDRDRTLWAELAARCFLAQRRPQEALAVLEAVRAQALPLRFLRGEVLESLGRNEEAGRWYEVAAQDYNGELFRAAIVKARVRLGQARQ